MILSEEQQDIVRGCGKLGYSPMRIARVLQLDPLGYDNFLNAFNDESSFVRELYEEGKAKGEYDVEIAAQTALTEGDPDAMEFLNKQRHFTRVENMKYELFGIPKK